MTIKNWVIKNQGYVSTTFGSFLKQMSIAIFENKVYYTLNMDISFGNGNSILKLLRGVSHSQIEFGVGIQSK